MWWWHELLLSLLLLLLLELKVESRCGRGQAGVQVVHVALLIDVEVVAGGDRRWRLIGHVRAAGACVVHGGCGAGGGCALKAQVVHHRLVRVEVVHVHVGRVVLLLLLLLLRLADVLKWWRLLHLLLLLLLLVWRWHGIGAEELGLFAQQRLELVELVGLALERLAHESHLVDQILVHLDHVLVLLDDLLGDQLAQLLQCLHSILHSLFSLSLSLTLGWARSLVRSLVVSSLVRSTRQDE